MLIDAHQHNVPVILKELMLPEGFNPVPPSFAIRDDTTELFVLLLTSCMTEMYLQFINNWAVINVMYVRSLLELIEYYQLPPITVLSQHSAYNAESPRQLETLQLCRQDSICTKKGLAHMTLITTQ
ncbi:unnamed protein product [Schistosoma curassoni]|uniref:Uncharacterized protein n=1 Tax=Schistosoma curassoni TaxID=6186 RepID=A0A183JVH6_9TREM|nr:unnamed protein product [Schistosoma curassoni]